MLAWLQLVNVCETIMPSGCSEGILQIRELYATGTRHSWLAMEKVSEDIYVHLGDELSLA